MLCKRRTTEAHRPHRPLACSPVPPPQLGRIDAASANPFGRVPATDASLEEVQAFFTQLGAKPGAGEGAFSRKAPFTERQQVGVVG